MDDQAVDRELVEVYNELIGLVQEAKQAAWQATRPELHAAFTELRNFLGEEVHEVEEAEEAIDGRSGDLVSPTGQKVRNLRAKAGNEPGALTAQLLDDLRSVCADIRARAAELGDAPAADLFRRLAEGLDEHIARVASVAG
jgi:DNA-binding ferritin-like protein